MGMNQYGVVLVNLDSLLGSEIRKTSPCVVISPNELNRNLNTIVVAPMTTNQNNYPIRVRLNFQGKEGRIAIDQIRTIDSRRVVKTLGRIKRSEILELKDVLKQTFVD